MKASHHLKPASSFHVGSFGSFSQKSEIMSLQFCSPAGTSVPATELPMSLRMCSGFHWSSVALRIACAANFEIAVLTQTSHPADFISTTCESTVGSEDS